MGGKIPSELPGEISWNDLPIALILTDGSDAIRGWNASAEKIAKCDFDLESCRFSDLASKCEHYAFPFEKGDFRGFLQLCLLGTKGGGVKEAMNVAADIAHEIRNPLGSIELFASLLKKTLEKEEDIRRVEQIMQAVHLINERITGLIATMVKKETCKESVPLKSVLNDLLGPADLREDFLVCKLPTEEIRIRGNERLLRHLFITFIVDLLTAMPAGSKLDIILEVKEDSRLRYADIVFQLTASRRPVAFTEIVAGMNLPVLHHIVQLHEGFIHLDAHRIIVSLPVET
ncbi:MAG: hypothetical protein N2572_04615 [Syntrophales bacterium]|nr:hypothetical protein [Syntrophales bacterium]